MRLPSTATRLLAAAAILAAVLAATPASAGNGNLRNGEYNFCVSVRFNASAAELADIRTAFQSGSQIFADATDGQQQFGEIRIVNDSGASQSAEYWINENAGGAYATAGDYGVRGQHVMLWMDDDMIPGDDSAYTVAHEHAHHAFGVRDEYSGPGGAAECAAAPDTADLNFCLMDNYKSRGGRAVGAGFTLNEFCTSGNHDPDADTYQESSNGESCWETIGSHPTRAATAPAGLPTDGAPAAHTVDFVDAIGGLRAVLVLDRSGSMSINNRLTFAKRGAGTFVRLLEEGDGVGVASFSCSTSTNFPLTEITGPGTVAAARAAIDALSAGGATNIGGGLQRGLSQLTSQADRSCNEIIVLLSDGDHNCGTAPAAVIPALQDEQVTVFTVGVGSGISAGGQATLQSVANATGGRFFRVSNAFNLVGFFLRLTFESLGSGLLTREPVALAPGGVEQVPVLLEPGTDSATFALTFENPADVQDFSIVSPSGVIVDASGGPGVEVISEPNLLAFRVDAPEAGTWTAIVVAGAAPSGRADLFAFAAHPGVDLNVTVARPQVVFPEPILVRATPTYDGESIVGATVDGVVVRPDGSTVPIALADDGSGGDAVAGDGIYAATFNSYNDDGTYTFELQVQSVGGVTYSGEEIFMDPSSPSNSRPVPDFVRLGSATAIVTGVPDFVVAHAEIGPETLNLKSRGRFITAYIELPAGFEPEDIDPSTVAVTAVDGQPIAPIAAETKPTEIGDFDNDGIGDLMVKFPRQEVAAHLTPGMRAITIEGFAVGQLFIAERSVAVIEPGNNP